MVGTISAYALPYISIASSIPDLAGDPITPDVLRSVTQTQSRSVIPSDYLSRIREFDATNNRLTDYLRPISDAEGALQQAQDELAAIRLLGESAVTLSQEAETSIPDVNAFLNPTPPPIAARTSVRIDENTLVEGVSAGMVLSISSDNGEDFTFTFGAEATNWGQVVAQLNAAEIGVQARFDRTNPDEPRLVIEPTDGQTGFRINGNTARQVIDDLVGIASPYDGEYDPAFFVDGTANPLLSGGRYPQGMTFGNGGSVISAGAVDTIAAGTTLRFSGGDGIVRNWTASVPTSLRRFVLDINAMRGSVIADVTSDGHLRLRDAKGANISINGASGSFEASGGILRLSKDVEAPQQPGLGPNAIAARPTVYLDRDTVVSGAANGMRFSLSTDSRQQFTYTFGMSANTTTWGDIADALDAANIGLKMRFDSTIHGSPRMTLYSVDGKTGFRINGTSSRQVVDDLFGMVSSYDGGFSPDKFADGVNMPPVGLNATEQGMTFGIGASALTASFASTISMGSSIRFVDGDGITRTWAASGTNQSTMSLIDGIRAMGTNVVAELTSEHKIRLRSTDGRAIELIEATGDFNPSNGVMRFIPQVAPPAEPPPRSLADRLASIGRVMNYRINTFTSLLYSAAGNGIESEGLYAIAESMNQAKTTSGWEQSGEAVRASAAQIAATATASTPVFESFAGHLASLRLLESDYREVATDLKTFAAEMIDSYLTWDQAKDMASQIQNKLAAKTANMSSEQARDLLLLLG